ncbi:Gfo/Idh/MocA family oxidoreductase [Paenibacillus sp. ACRRX]|uniref:Gfo/Idh/MocA family protein n=1 Tax=Paenibacillus sp. ACRRX TaxID=2918206 RepID=UPI001EF649F4|nr:Gfo/Idh/MocA family oxidoreductase [Paenibacillus sp. ACRRX]MCG7406847.1 Gfo/Idh/MocA family oxidoreductase [Paenibacillus sp. ACRRX]
MKIGMIGIGDIASKAYLPILATRQDIELSIASRNQEVVHQAAQQYRIKQAYTSVSDLIASGIDAAFVHTATMSHPEIVKQLISAGVHVFVDKPIAYTLSEAEQVVSYAKQHDVQLMVGFNRRFAPMYRDVKQHIQAPETIFLQKNRTGPLSDLRTTLFDDFIHVVDTLLYFTGEPTALSVNAKIEQQKAHYVVLNLHKDNTTAIGMMNRNTGVTDERLEMTGNQRKLVVHNMVNAISFEHNQEQHRTFEDWTTTLYRRGFVDMINHFIEHIKQGTTCDSSGEAALTAHEICERMIHELVTR